MGNYDLSKDDDLRAACESLGPPHRWNEESEQWMRDVANTLERIRGAGEEERSSADFQEWLWEDNRIAAVGQGTISVDRAIEDAAFRRWLAKRSLEPLPPTYEERVKFMRSLYEATQERLQPFLSGNVPRLKIFRVLAALYPEAMTTVASTHWLRLLAKAMGADNTLDSVSRHLWVRRRLDSALGPSSAEPVALAERMSLPWALFARFVRGETDPPETRLVPLPAARRRRGLTAVRGLFPAVLSILDFVQEGVTRDALLDFLRTAAPEVKTSSLGVTINVIQSELGTVRFEDGKYALTERGERVLESGDPIHLADWLLTRVLAVDKAIVELRDHGPLPSSALLAAVRSMNPSWTSDFVPQAIISWLRSMGLVQADAQYRHTLTKAGREWAALIHWDPESLEPVLPPPLPPPDPADVALPELGKIISSVNEAGHFPSGLVARLHAGLWSHKRRHFAILTGLSGSGKTLLAREYAKALTNGGADQRVLTLAVQPGWYDPGALLGFVNPLRGESYASTPFLAFLMRAAADTGQAYVAVLDEMNLSHPEQYMAPLLSAMETGETIPLHMEGDILDGIPSSVPYPSNLVLIGTVNMDETTHGLSDKVLDRAFVLEFWDVDLDSYPRWGARGLESAAETRARDLLASLMRALSPARLHFGWRVVDDVVEFLKQATGVGDVLPLDAALDAVVYAKVLPKLRGEDGPRFRAALTECEKALETFGLTTSLAKVAELRRDLEATGSARFWR